MAQAGSRRQQLRHRARAAAQIEHAMARLQANFARQLQHRRIEDVRPDRGAEQPRQGAGQRGAPQRAVVGARRAPLLGSNAHRSAYTLKRMLSTSPSLTTYVLPSMRTRPRFFASAMVPAATRSS